MAQSPEEMKAKMIANLKEKTGKTLPEWLAITKDYTEDKHGAIVKRLKADHGIGHGFANLVARETLSGGSEPTEVDLVANQYTKGKEGLRPIYDKLVEAVQGFGGDVEISPKKSYVSLRRKKQFGLIQPSTKTRVDIGLNLKGVEPEGRLEASGSFNSMVSHRVRITDIGDVDDEVTAWLQQAYEGA
ncbi:MAG: DUF4287 domain-containing protein [Acidobacteriota bacterium]